MKEINRENLEMVRTKLSAALEPLEKELGVKFDTVKV